jgi:general secretion pathway protein K
MKRFRMRPPPLWQFADYFVLSFNDPAALEMVGSVIGTPMEGTEGFGGLGGDIQVAIVDEESKINLNMATMGSVWQELVARELAALFQPSLYDPLFEEANEEGERMTREDIIAAIIDYADVDEIVYGTSGFPEANTYETDDNAGELKNAPYDTIEELHRVKGINDDFWAAFVDPEPDHPQARSITVWGSGKINVNTADPMVLYAILCSLSSNPVETCAPENLQNLFTLIQYMVDVRSLLGVPFANTGRFLQNVGSGVQDIPGVSMNRDDVNKYLTVDSQVFSIYATAQVGKSKKRIWTVVDTRGANSMNGGTVLYWKMY